MRSPWIVVSLLAIGVSGPSLAAESTVVRGVAERMTQDALAAGAAGDLDLRETLLNQAINIAPEHPAAHWAKGQIQVDGEWRSVDEAQQLAAGDTKRSKYDSLRKAAPDTPTAHLELARWCERADLNDEARYHWLKILAVDPDHRGALTALGSTWFDGELVPRDQAKALKTERIAEKKTNPRWNVRIAGWERAFAAGTEQADAARAELIAEVDESAILQFEKLAVTGQGRTPGEVERHAEMSRAFIEALGQMPSFEASTSLARYAVYADDQSVRDAAVEQLKNRPLQEVVPTLISGLASQIESRGQIVRSETGRVSYTHEFIAEGPDAQQVAEISRDARTAFQVRGNESEGQLARAAERARNRSFQQVEDFQAEAARLEQLAAELNVRRAETNARIIPILEQVTGESLGSEPLAWWTYWNDYNGYDNYRPTETYRTALSYVEPLRASCECFAAGTLVWTKTGMQEIETLQAGDLVLSLDVNTGERCFRPVLDTTRREPSPLMHLATDDYQLLCTPGHPFWVEGRGWRMAKELEAGDRILSATGAPREVRVVASSEVVEEAFNLVVEGHNNYFVGREALLSHDNTPRRPDRERDGTW